MAKEWGCRRGWLCGDLECFSLPWKSFTTSLHLQECHPILASLLTLTIQLCFLSSSFILFLRLFLFSVSIPQCDCYHIFLAWRVWKTWMKEEPVWREQSNGIVSECMYGTYVCVESTLPLSWMKVASPGLWGFPLRWKSPLSRAHHCSQSLLDRTFPEKSVSCYFSIIHCRPLTIVKPCPWIIGRVRSNTILWIYL